MEWYNSSPPEMIQVNPKHEPLSTTPLAVSTEEGCKVFTLTVPGSGGQRGVDGKFVKRQGADLISEPSHSHSECTAGQLAESLLRNASDHSCPLYDQSS